MPAPYHSASTRQPMYLTRKSQIGCRALGVVETGVETLDRAQLRADMWSGGPGLAVTWMEDRAHQR